MENPIKIHNLGVPLFLETPICKQNTTPFPLNDAHAPIFGRLAFTVVTSDAIFGLFFDL